MSDPTASTNGQTENQAGREARPPDGVLSMHARSPWAEPPGSIELKRGEVTLCIVPQPTRGQAAAMARQAQRDNAKLFAAAPLVMEALIDLLAVCMEGAPPQDLPREMLIRRCDAITRATSAIRVAINGPDRPANQQDQSTAHVEATLGVTGSRPSEKVNLGSINTNPNPAPAGPPPVSRTVAKMPVFHAGCDGATPAEAAPPGSNAVEIPPPMRCAICQNPGTDFRVPMDGSHAGKWLCAGCSRSHAANTRYARGRVIEVPPKSEVAAFTRPGRAPVHREPAATPAPPPKHEPVGYLPRAPFAICDCCGNAVFPGSQIDVKA